MARMALHLLILLVAVAMVSPAQAQRDSGALPIGTITLNGSTYSCSQARNSGRFLAGMTCQNASIGCSNTDTIGLTFGYIGPANPQGTVVFFSGGTGMLPQRKTDVVDYATSYQSYFEVVYLEWDSPWEKAHQATGLTRNILQAGCRPATFLSYINGSNLHKGAMCAQGSSAGSAAIAYAMSWYGAGSYLTNVELLSGPVLSEIDQGCSAASNTTTICPAGNAYCSPRTQPWIDPETYTYNNQGSINNWSGLSGCGLSSGQGNLSQWAGMSIVDGAISGATPIFNFPNVAKHGWLCSTQSQQCGGSSTCPNNSAPQGKWFYDAVSATNDTNLVVTGITNCSGAEMVVSGTDPDSGNKGSVAIENDMLASCQIKR